MNWIAPSVVRADHQKQQTQLLQFVTGEHDAQDNNLMNVVLALMPKFAHNANTVWLQEVHALQQLGSCRVDCDHSFGILFKKTSSARDQRPLKYDIKVCTSSTKRKSLTKSPWAGSTLMDGAYVHELDQLSVNDMISVEDAAENALPESTDPLFRLPRAVRYCQLGPAVYVHLLKSAMDGSIPPAGIIICDFGLQSGCALRAFLQLWPTLKVPCFFCGFAETDKALEYFTDLATQTVIQNFRNGTYGPCPSDAKAEDLTMPQKPDLCFCVWGSQGDGPVTDSIHIPQQTCSNGRTDLQT